MAAIVARSARCHPWQPIDRNLFVGKDEESMSRRRWIISIAAVALPVAAIVIAQRVRRVVAYDRIVSKPSTARLLSVRPTTVTPEYARQTDTVNTGYSTFRVPSAKFDQLRAFETWLDLRVDDRSAVLLTEIHYDTTHSPDGNFTFTGNALNTYPAASDHVFFMSSTDLTQHTLLIMKKLSNSYGERGIAFFETDRTKGIIRYGSDPYYSDGIHLIVWDRQWPLCQEITLTIADPQLRKETADAIAASYTFTVTSLPGRDRLLEMAQQAADSFSPSAD